MCGTSNRRPVRNVNLRSSTQTVHIAPEVAHLLIKGIQQDNIAPLENYTFVKPRFVLAFLSYSTHRVIWSLSIFFVVCLFASTTIKLGFTEHSWIFYILLVIKSRFLSLNYLWEIIRSQIFSITN